MADCFGRDFNTRGFYGHTENSFPHMIGEPPYSLHLSLIHQVIIAQPWIILADRAVREYASGRKRQKRLSLRRSVQTRKCPHEKPLEEFDALLARARLTLGCLYASADARRSFNLRE